MKLRPSRARQVVATVRDLAWIVAAVVLASSAAASAADVRFDYNGTIQTWSVPAGVSSIRIRAVGAKGADSCYTDGPRGGAGGETVAIVGVSTGEVLHFFVGGVGEPGPCGVGPEGQDGEGGFNGGGRGGLSLDNSFEGSGGGGATDVRRFPWDLGDRIVVAGGGGGAGIVFKGRGAIASDAPAGDGGGLYGSDGPNGNSQGGEGGEPKRPGFGGANGGGGTVGYPGFQDEGGGGADSERGFAGGGGGGGWFGGGGGGSGDLAGGGGGGGSGHGSGELRGGVNRGGNGFVEIDFNPNPPSRLFDFTGNPFAVESREYVNLVGGLHLVSKVTGSEIAGWTVRLHSNLEHTKGTGVETQYRYEATGSNDDTVQLPPGPLRAASFRPRFVLHPVGPCSPKPCAKASPFSMDVVTAFTPQGSMSDVDVQVTPIEDGGGGGFDP
jgi:hypothetical protein